MSSVLSRIPVKKQKPIAKGLLGVAAFVFLYAVLFVMWFAETTETSGWLWWQETKEIPLSERLPQLFVAIGLLLVAVACVVVGVRLFGMQGSLKKYAPILTGVESIPIQRIADITNSTSNRVYRDVQAMIDSGMISDIYIDYKAGQVVSRKYIPKSSYKTVVTCSGCGGKNELIVGITRTCSFCGQPLVLEER
jgi:hypothetical protein